MALQALAAPPPESVLVHGDAKLANVLSRPGDSRPILVDWELSHWDDPALDLGSLFCDLALSWMAPETAERAFDEETLTRLLAAVWRGYEADGPRLSSGFHERVLRWGALTLLFYVYGFTQFENDFGPRALRLAEFAVSFLESPAGGRHASEGPMTRGLVSAFAELARRIDRADERLRILGDGRTLDLGPIAEARPYLEAYVYERIFADRKPPSNAGAHRVGITGSPPFVARVAQACHGASYWEGGWSVTQPGREWAFISNGVMNVFVTDPADLSSPLAELIDDQPIRLRLPCFRENLVPHLFM